MLGKVKEEIAALLSKAADVDKARALASMQMPRNNFGDLCSSIAFELAKERKQNPVAIAADIAKKVGKHKYVETVAAAGPYINFFLSSGFFLELAQEAAEKPDYGKGRKRRAKVIVEFPSVNPNKPWHIGHLRNALLGDSVARILEFSGWLVERMDYIDDLGLQVGQSMYWYQKSGKSPQKGEKFDHFIGEQYVQAAAAMEKDTAVAEEVRKLLKRLEHGEPALAETAREMSEKVVHAQYETDFALSIYHDVLVFESDIIKTVFAEGMEKLKKSKSVHLEKEGKNAGCWVVQLGEKYKDLKDDQKVIIRSDGTATYTGKDIIFQLWKFGLLENEFGYERFVEQPNGKTAYKTSAKGKPMPFGNAGRVINIIGVEQSYPQAVVKDTLAALGYGKEAEGLVHLAYEHATLPEGKFSGRKGTWLGYTVDEFIEEAGKKAQEKISKEMSEDEKEKIARIAGIAAIKFSFLKPTPEKKLLFEWERALSLEGDSGPYLQYAYVRTNGILKKWGGKVESLKLPENTELNEDEKAVLRHLALFGETVERAAADLRPHYIAEYALELATVFSKFYTKNQVLNAENEQEKEKRLVIVAASANVLRNSLHLLGIEAPEKM